MFGHLGGEGRGGEVRWCWFFYILYPRTQEQKKWSGFGRQIKGADGGGLKWTPTDQGPQFFFFFNTFKRGCDSNLEFLPS